MRKIKFRCWDKKRKVMRGVMDLKWFNKGGLRVNATEDEDNYEPLLLHFDEGILIQFTGLKDKKGKEIYEGDILDWCNECTILIKWAGTGFYYKVLTQKDKNVCAFDIRLHRSDESAKIIGNAYANPELIPEEDEE